MTDQNKTGEQPASGETQIDKAEFEKLKSEYDNLKKSNEDLRLEFMSEEYLEFLNQKSGTPAKKEAEPAKSASSLSDDLKGLTPEQIYEKAVKAAEAKIEEKLSERERKAKEDADARTQSEVKKFAQTHEDFETYRPVMYGLSLDPKYADFSLKELYDAAKSHVKSLAGASEAEKEKSRKSQGEKPGHSSSSFQKAGKKLSDEEANEEAWEEVVGDKGLPAAI